MEAGLSGPEALEHVKKALLASYSAVMRRGDRAGFTRDTPTDLKTSGDVAASKAWSEYFGNSGLPVTVYTEELENPLSHSPAPVYSAVGDEIDGTHNLKYGLGMLPYGSILGIADKADPRFRDFIASGFLEFNSGNLFYAVREGGAYIIKGWTGKETKAVRLKTSGKKRLDEPELNVIADVYMLGGLAGAFMPLVAKRGGDFRSTAVHLAMVACGSCDIFISGDNCPNPKKRRTGEEIGPGYLLVREAGGAVFDWNGNDLGEERVALPEKKTFHVVVAATEELGREFVEEMHRTQEIADYLKRKKIL